MSLLELLEGSEDKRYDEINRIMGLPRVADISDEVLKEFSSKVLLHTSDWDMLQRPQAAALISYLRFGGLVGAIGVGFGKTCVAFKAADFAYKKGKRKILLLVPANCVVKTVHEIPELRQQVSLNYPIHILGGLTPPKRLDMSKQPSGLFIMSYSQLQLKDTVEILNNIAPETIISDECQNLAQMTASRTMRIGRYMDANPSTEFLAMSGTLTSKGLYDYAHITRWALKDKAPLPSNDSELTIWADVLNTTWSEYTVGNSLLPLVEWAKVNYKDEKFDKSEVASLRRAYKYRFTTAPGVVSSGDAQVNVSLMFENVPVKVPDTYEGYAELKQHIYNVEEFMMNPSGEEIEYPIHKFKSLYELTSGMFLELYWPEVATVEKRLKVSAPTARDLLDRSEHHLKATQQYTAELRRWIEENAADGLDSPSLLEDELTINGNNNVGDDLYTKWAFMKSKEFEELLPRDERSHRVCDYKIKEAVNFYKSLKKGTGCLFWYHHQEIGNWLHSEFKKQGIQVIFADAGKRGEHFILDKKNANLPIIASIGSHGTGKNLQHFQENYIVQFSRSATTMEQLIGRTHRMGQKADQLIMHTNFTTEFDHLMFASTLADSLYIAQSMNRQKLVYADYNPVPEKFSSQIIKERGLYGIGNNSDKLLQGLI